MPALIPEQNLREKFSDDNYVDEFENMIKEKFLQNLDVSVFKRLEIKGMFDMTESYCTDILTPKIS
jgi:hypothetical protein